MGLSRKLQKWVDADLISTDQRNNIQTYEKSHAGNLLKYGLMSVGGFSILLGIALMVAANWQHISDTLKIGVHFGINLALAILIFVWRDNPNRRIHREAALFALWGLTATLIALIGQVFQLGGTTFPATRLWFWITTPMILYFVRNTYLVTLWAILFVLYIPLELFTQLDNIAMPAQRMCIDLLVSAVLPIGIWFMGIWPALCRARPIIARAFFALGIIGAITASSASSLLFYNFGDFGGPSFIILRVTAAITLACVLGLGCMIRRAKHLDARQRNWGDIVCFGAAMTAIPYLIFIQNDMLAMLHFIVLWLGIGYLAQRDGIDRLVSLSILLITARLFIGFLELFGSLMQSGFGFIVIGLVLIALVYGARVIKRQIAKGSVT